MKVLFLAFNFPPESGSGSFRPLFFANHLVQMGVEVHVLTAKVEDYLGRSIDWSLYERCRSEVSVTRCSVRRPQQWLFTLRGKLTCLGKGGGAASGTAPAPRPKGGLWQGVKDHVTELLATPDPQVGWLPDCLRQGKRIIAEKRPDLIFATAGPWSSLVAAMLLKRSTGVPLVLDFRDPWTSNPAFSRRPRLCRGIDRWLEERVLRCCDGIVANTDPLREDFLKRYPFLAPHKVTALTNGFEEYLPQPVRPAGRPLTIVHTGELYLSRDPVPLLEGVRKVVESGRARPGELRLQLVGGIEDDGRKVRELLEGEILREVVTLVPRVPYHEAQRYAAQADLLLLVQPDFPLQVPRKLYEYMALCKPILCIAEAASATGRLVSEHGLGTVCGNEAEELAGVLAGLVEQWRAGRLPPSTGSGCDRFSNREISLRLHRFFDNVISAGHETPVLEGQG